MFPYTSSMIGRSAARGAVVRHEEERRIARLVDVAQQIEHTVCRLRVEVAGRLSARTSGLHGKRASDGDALLLAPDM